MSKDYDMQRLTAVAVKDVSIYGWYAAGLVESVGGLFEQYALLDSDPDTTFPPRIGWETRDHLAYGMSRRGGDAYR